MPDRRRSADADLAETQERAHKPYIAMLIARCVQPDHGNGNRAELPSSRVSLRTFAERLGVATTTASDYLRKSDMLAESGEVPPAARCSAVCAAVAMTHGQSPLGVP